MSLSHTHTPTHTRTHTGENIRIWLEKALGEVDLKVQMLTLATLDGGSNGQLGVKLIDGLEGKVKTCDAHQVQRSILKAEDGDSTPASSVSGTANPAFRAVRSKIRRISKLCNQSHVFAGKLREEQLRDGVPAGETLSTETTSATRWSGAQSQIRRCNILAPFINKAIEDRVATSGGLKGFTTVDEDSAKVREIVARDLTMMERDWVLAREMEAVGRQGAECTTLIETSSSTGAGAGQPGHLGRVITSDIATFAVYDLKKDAEKPSVWVPGTREAGPSR
jgi:hypothetical protein